MRKKEEEEYTRTIDMWFKIGKLGDGGVGGVCHKLS